MPFESEELNLVQQTFGSKYVQTTTSNLIRVYFEKTFVRNCTVTLHCVDDYPFTSIGSDVISNFLPEITLKKLNAGLQQQISSVKGDKPYSISVLTWVKDLIDTNPFLFCADEISEIKKITANDPNITMKLLEKKSSLLLKFSIDSYVYNCKILIPENYPAEQILLTTTQTTFHPFFIGILQSLLTSLLYDLSKPEYVWRSADERRAAFLAATQAAVDKAAERERQKTMPSEATAWTPNRSELTDLKHDIKFLSQMSQLKDQTDDKKQRRKQVRLRKAETARENAKMRGELPKHGDVIDVRLNDHISVDLTKTNLFGELGLKTTPKSDEKADEKADEKVKEIDNEEEDDDNDDDDDESEDKPEIHSHSPAAIPHRSLLPVVSLVCDEFAGHLLSMTCAICEKRLLPTVCPSNWSERDLKPSEKIERLSCGDWYHEKCIVAFLSTPPFDNRRCLVCLRAFTHQKYNRDFQLRKEKDYLNAQKKARELADVTDCLGL